MRLRKLLLLCLPLCCSSATAQDILVAHLLRPETVFSNNQVSAGSASFGAVVTDIVLSRATKPYIWFKNPYNGTLSMHVISADGTYEARYSLKANVRAKGWVSVDLPTEYPKFFESRRFSATQVAFVIRRDDDNTLTVASWSPTSKREQTVALLLRATDGAYYFDAENKRLACRHVIGSTFNYDTACEVPLAKIKAMANAGSALIIFRKPVGNDIPKSETFQF